MSTLAKTYTFTSGTTIVAAEVNQNFDDIVSYVNTNAIVKDGTKAMTAALSLVDAEPSGANVALRRRSGYRSCLGSHPASSLHTVGGGASGTFAYMNSPVTDPFGYTPDYIYDLLILVTGTIFISGAGQSVFIRAESPNGTGINVFGPGTTNEAEFTAGTNNVYMPICFTAVKLSIPAATVPTYSLMYKIVGVTTTSIWATALAFIQPHTRQLPN